MLPQLRQHRHLEVRRRMLALLLARLPVLLCLLLVVVLPNLLQLRRRQRWRL